MAQSLPPPGATPHHWSSMVGTPRHTLFWKTQDSFVDFAEPALDCDTAWNTSTYPFSSSCTHSQTCIAFWWLSSPFLAPSLVLLTQEFLQWCSHTFNTTLGVCLSKDQDQNRPFMTGGYTRSCLPLGYHSLLISQLDLVEFICSMIDLQCLLTKLPPFMMLIGICESENQYARLKTMLPSCWVVDRAKNKLVPSESSGCDAACILNLGTKRKGLPAVWKVN
jgi:hypothetical protein